MGGVLPMTTLEIAPTGIVMVRVGGAVSTCLASSVIWVSRVQRQ